MSSKAAKARSRWPASAGSKQIVGCMLPSPAWPTTPMVSAAGRGDRVAAVEERRDPRPRHGDVVDERAAELLQRRQRHPPGLRAAGRPRRGRRWCARTRRRPPGRAAASASISRGRGLAPGVGLRHQQRVRAAVEVGLEQVVDGADAGVVHDLEQAGHQAAGHHPLDHLAGLRRRRERGGEGDRALRRRAQRERRLGDDAERALRADEQPGQVVAGHALDGAPPGAQHPPVGEHDLQAHHVVGGDAVLHAAQAAGVGGEVAADRAPVVAGGVRRIEQPGAGDGVAQRLVHHARLDDGEPVGRRRPPGRRPSGS